jgi:uncharacterized protein (DUF58 family)
MIDPRAAIRFEERAQALTRTLPALLLDAERIAATVALGVHGRRRSGMGETFWQFRRYRDGDMPVSIDWRKSARSHRLFVRENEWEAAGTVWLWMNRSPTMDFRSHLATDTKAERALVLLLALAQLLLRGAERIGYLGSGEVPRSDRLAAPRLAQALTATGLTDADAPTLPPGVELTRFSSVVLFSDFLEPIERVGQTVAQYSSSELRGHLVQVLDPAEETFPFAGRLEFEDAFGRDRLTVGRAEGLRDDYRRTMARHRAELARLAARVGWSFTVHRTDAPATGALLALYAMLSGEAELARTHRAPPAGQAVA